MTLSNGLREFSLVADGRPQLIGSTKMVSELQLPTIKNLIFDGDQISLPVKSILQRHSSTGQNIELLIDGASHKGKVKSLMEGLAAGAFDGTNIPQNKIIVVEVELFAQSEKTILIPFDTDTVKEMILQMLMHRGWRQVYVRNEEEATASKMIDGDSTRYKFKANWKPHNANTELKVLIMASNSSGEQHICDKSLREILEPIQQNRFSPPFD